MAKIVRSGKKNDSFISRTWKESQLCLLQVKLDCFLPLLATSSPTLSKNYKLVFLLEIKEGDPKWEDGPRICFILPADAASYIIHSVIRK